MDVYFYMLNYILLTFTVTPEMDLIVPDKAADNTEQCGVCYVKSFPLFPSDEIHVSTGERCTITKHPVTNNDSYVTAVFFTLNNFNNYCQRISCQTQIHEEVKHISISKCCGVYLCPLH